MAQILIFGYGRVGHTIANNLDFPKNEIMIADWEDTAVERAKIDGFHAVKSSLENDEDLIKAGVGSTIKYLYCVSGNDDLNIFVTLSARFLDKNLQIMARAEDANAKAKLLLAGANDTIDFNAIAAHKMSSLLVSPRVYNLIEGFIYKQNSMYHDYKVIMEEVAIKQDSKLIGQTTISIDLKENYNLILIGIHNKNRGFIYNIDKLNKVIASEDVLVVMGRENDIEKLVADI